MDQNTNPPSGPQPTPPGETQLAAHSTTPQIAEPNAPQPGPVNPTTHKSSKKLFLIVGILLVALLAGGVGISAYTMMKKQALEKANPTTSGSNQTLTPAQIQQVQQLQQAQPENNFVAFVQSNPTATEADYRLSIYDLKENKLLPPIPQFSTREKQLLLLGEWSPTGQYLPILRLLPENRQGEALYIFDAASKTVKKLYTPTTDDTWSSTSFGHSTGWLDNTTLVVSRTPVTDTTIELTTISLAGKKQPRTVNESMTDVSIKTADSTLTMSYQVKTTQPKLTRTSLHIDGKLSNIDLPGEIVGKVSNVLVSLDKPQTPNLFGAIMQPEDSSNSDLLQQMTDLQNQNLSESELRDMALEMLEGSGSAKLYIADLDTGKVLPSIEIDKPGWRTKSAQTDASGSFLILHQADRTLYPQKERYVQLNPKVPTKQHVLLERAVNGQNIYYSGQQITGTGLFFISSDNQWLVSMTAEPVNGEAQTQSMYGGNEESRKTSITAFYIRSGKTIPICSLDCASFRMYNPKSLVLSYKK